ncbi:MAG: FAD-dependent oxidoreductase [Pseudomonadota bacterium]
MSTNDHYVIIGNGPAGNRAADTLRDRDPHARISILTDEPMLFYYKHKLTRFMAGEIAQDKLVARTLDSYKHKNIRLRVNNVVERIDSMEKTLCLAHMEKIRYTKLIIASGSRPGLPDTMLPFAPHISLISSFSDIQRLKARITAAQSFFILGGDLVGFDVLNALRTMGKTVSFLLQPRAFWPFTLDEAMTRDIMANLAPLGITPLTGDSVTAIEPEKDGYQVTLAQGTRTKVDMVMAFPGLTPNAGFALGSGIDVDHGILVNEHLKTNLDDIYACGSCAQIFNPRLKTYTTSVGWQNALVQGEVAAQNLLGGSAAAEPAPQDYFEVQGVKIKTSWWDVQDLKGELQS